MKNQDNITSTADVQQLIDSANDQRSLAPVILLLGMLAFVLTVSIYGGIVFVQWIAGIL